MQGLCKDEKLLENALNFEDLITLTVKLFEENKDLLKNYRERFKYVSVDEYQDIDENQYKLIRLLVPQNGNIFVIGDPNQAIYGFRGGNAKFFNDFKEDYPDTQMINLKNNYRSTNSIVDASNQMINCFNIVSAFDKPHEKITIHKAPTDKAEAEFIASTIENLIGGHSFFSIDSQRSAGDDTDYSFSDFAILYRTSSQLKPLIEALERSGMPYVKLSDDLLCDRKMFPYGDVELTDLMKVFKNECISVIYQTPMYATDRIFSSVLQKVTYFYMNCLIDAVIVQDIGLASVIREKCSDLAIIWGRMGYARTPVINENTLLFYMQHGINAFECKNSKQHLVCFAFGKESRGFCGKPRCEKFCF